jgi:hypothetical protein
MKHLYPERLDDLVLARLAVPAARAPSPSSVARALFSFVSGQLRQHEWRRTLDEALARLRERHWIEAHELQLTERGRARLQATLHLASAPSAKTWAQFRKRYLPRLFLERPESFGEVVPNCAAAVLAERLGVALAGDGTPQQVLDAWLARRLGLDRLSLDELRCTLLARELGLPRRKNKAETLRMSIAHLSGAPNAQPERVLVALTARWLLAEEPPAADAAPADLAPEAAAAAPPATGVSCARPAALPAPRAVDLVRFAQRVRAAAEGPQARSYGDNKVFIGSVWQALRADSEIGQLGETGFKRWLVEAHRRGALELGRADLVSAMDPRDVRASETTHQNATYHFIHRGPPA